MKKLLTIATILSLAFSLTAQNYQVKQSDYSQIRISFSTPELKVNDAKLLNNVFNTLSYDNFTSQSVAGMPALPTMMKIIEVPLGDGLKYSIESMQCDTVDGSVFDINKQVVPAQPSRSKSDMSPARLVKNDAAYATDAFYGAPVIELESIGIARDRNLARIIYNPIRWNPVTNKLIIVKEITVTVHQQNADIVATKRMQSLYHSPAFNSGVNVINTLGSKDHHTDVPIRYTIVAHSSFRGALDEFAAWKRRKGFIVDLVYTDDAIVGSTTSSIQSYLQGLYDNATAESPAPTYVLLVGDVAQVPAFYLTAYGEQQYSDLSYCCWTGNDNIPDCYYGRFSAQDLSQLTPQISKTLMYEQYTFPDPSYLSTAALVAGVDGGYSSDNAYKYGDPAMDYVAKTYITTSNGFSNIVYYKNNTSFAPAGVTVTGSSQASGTAAALRTLYNNGCGFVNYTAHGGTTEWSDPSFTNSNVGQMTNNNKPMVMIGNCCLSNSFQIDACFGEALLRKNNNAGAVAYIGGSNSTYWTEDFYWTVGVRTNISNTMNPNYDANNLGMYDKLFHSHNEAYSNWYPTMGAMIYAGNMAVEGSSTSSGMKQYYWQIYHLMGDPSLMPYIHGEADVMTANVPGAISIGANSLTVTAEPFSYVALTDVNGNLCGATYADANGNATIHFPALSIPGTYEVAITAQGFQTFFQNINVITNGPYVNVTDFTPRATLEANGNISFDITLKNVGVNDASTLSIEFQNTDGSILIDTTGIIDLGTGLQQGHTLDLHNICHGHIWGHIPDQANTSIKVIVRWGNTVNDISRTDYSFKVNADDIKLQSSSFTNNIDNDGSATLTIVNRNDGHLELHNGTISLICLDPSLTVTNPNSTVSSIAVGQSFTNTYNIIVNGSTPENRTIPFIQTVSNGFRTTKDTIKVTIGQDNSLFTFEENNWGGLNWNNGTYPWQITNQGAYAGTYCARSYTWSGGYGSGSGNNSQSELSITWTSTIDDSITFYKNVSSEGSYDFFRFYIDGVQKEELSGTDNNWSRSAYFVPQGTHTFKFSYEKDYSQSRGSDCAWIDNIHFPLNGTAFVYILDSTCQGSEYIFRDDTINTEGMSAGLHQFSDTTETEIYFLSLVLNPTPSVTISGGDVTIRNGETVRLTAEGAESYIWSSGETSAIIDVYPTETTTYTVTGYNGNCSSTASTTITVDGTIGIDNPQRHYSEFIIQLYPNPAQNELTISGAETSRITVIDITGKTLIDKAVNGNRNTIDISQLNNGIYFLQATDNNGNKKTLKFVKKQ